MFDIGFSELMVIGVVALLVIGPEKLPKVARTLGHLLGRAQRYVNDVKSGINREIQLESSVRKEYETARNVVEAPAQAAVAELNEAVQQVTQAAPTPVAEDTSSASPAESAVVAAETAAKPAA